MGVVAVPRGDGLWLYCPGCCSRLDDAGSPAGGVIRLVLGPGGWDWDGDTEAPTVSPSILTRSGPDGVDVCHAFLRGGRWEFLPDSTHALAGQTVPAMPLPNWFTTEEA